VQRGLQDKAKALETELATYKSENASLRQLRKQQEAAVADAHAQREEVSRFAKEEKARTLAWCEEQKQAGM
tara:strand:+ start:285 stop:497 length:213 start_codon:yes stop_codon:yes gene_type:complete